MFKTLVIVLALTSVLTGCAGVPPNVLIDVATESLLIFCELVENKDHERCLPRGNN